MTNKGNRFSLVGPGRVGSSVGMALQEKGWNCVCVIQKNEKRKQLKKLKTTFETASVTNLLSSLPDNFNVLLISVQDDEIRNVAAYLSAHARVDWSSKVVFHMSGITGVEVLRPLRKLGAATGALHPIAAFAAMYRPESAHNIFFDFHGDRRALLSARRILKTLDSTMLILRSKKERTLLHVASTIASNSTVVAVRAAEKLISDFINPRDAKALMASLLASTVNNLSSSDGILSLTGPLARGDIEVISEHLNALENEKMLLQFYKSWSRLGIQLLLNDRDDARLKKIKQILEKR